MSPTSYTIQSRPPVRAFAIAAVGALLGAFLIVFAASGEWIVLDVILVIVGALLLLGGVLLAGVGFLVLRRTTVTLTLDDDGYQLVGGGRDHRGRWLEVNQVTQSEDGLHVTVYHGPERRTHVLFSGPDQIDAVLDDMRTRLKDSRRRVE